MRFSFKHNDTPLFSGLDYHPTEHTREVMGGIAGRGALSKKQIAAKAAAVEKKAAKDAEKAAKDAAKEAARIANLKPYFKAGIVPNGYREATMKEAIDAKKVFLWGVRKADSKIVNSMFKHTDNTQELIEDVSSKIILKMVKFNQLKKLIAAMEGDERVVKERTAKKAEFANLKDEIIALQDKKKKLEALKE